MTSKISQKKKILIAAYAISPYSGSEFGVGWNFVSKLSEFYDITVMYGTSGVCMGNRDAMLAYLQSQPADGVKYVYVEPNALVRLFDWMNRSVTPLFFSFSYMLWQRQVLATAKKLKKNEDYSLVHQLNTIGFRHPGFLWKLDLPYVWGPVGGSSDLNDIFFPILSKGNYLRNKLRNWTNRYFLRHSARVRNAATAAKAVFCATSADRDNFRRFLNVDCQVIRENSVLNIKEAIKPTGAQVQFVWAGSIDERKALNLLLSALDQLPSRSDWCLHVIGDGPIKSMLQARAVASELDKQIVWHGQVQREDVLRIMREADVHIMPSIMDSNPTVLLEAFEMGLPSIALDQFGAHDLITAETGFKVRVNTLEEIVEQLAQHITFCLDNHATVDLMKTNVLLRQKELHWDISLRQVRDLYEKVSHE
ncbi:glycosyltransferase family 4 protein [Janthinobacterium sp. PSPC2-1]|jgi:glycosyltransferase involved in cell wall biosynthesis|uniref:glycosyltransferase family 4 protein n=1 Tax=unclassified Janthinobacterium TaxID=2610881 RepID=UPI003CFA70AB